MADSYRNLAGNEGFHYRGNQWKSVTQLFLTKRSLIAGHYSEWNLGLTVLSSNGKSITVIENYKFTSSFFGETACNQTAQALMPAVQNLIGKLTRSPQFINLLSN